MQTIFWSSALVVLEAASSAGFRCMNRVLMLSPIHPLAKIVKITMRTYRNTLSATLASAWKEIFRFMIKAMAYPIAVEIM